MVEPTYCDVCGSGRLAGLRRRLRLDRRPSRTLRFADYRPDHEVPSKPGGRPPGEAQFCPRHHPMAARLTDLELADAIERLRPGRR